MSDSKLSKDDLLFSVEAYEKKFPEVNGIFKDSRENIGDIKNTCLVVLDTNVLLAPYRISKKGLADVKNVYEKLIRQKSLLIPEHVVREFSERRGIVLGEIHDTILTNTAAVPEVKDYPVLDGLDEYGELLDVQRRCKELVGSYNIIRKELADRIREWTWSDPVVSMYGILFQGGCYINHSLNNDEILVDYEERHKYRIAPGYKDSKKPVNVAGDLIIWHTILELGERTNKDVVFVSGDVKNDWWYQSSGQHFVPKFELLNEYNRRSNGRNVYLIQFSEFLELFEGQEDTVNEIRKWEDDIVESLVEREASKFNKLEKYKRSNLRRFFLKTSCDVCGFEAKGDHDILELHQIKPLMDSEQVSAKHYVTLCRNCHSKVHSIPSKTACICPTCKLTVADEDSNFCSNCGQKL